MGQNFLGYIVRYNSDEYRCLVALIITLLCSIYVKNSLILIIFEGFFFRLMIVKLFRKLPWVMVISPKSWRKAGEPTKWSYLYFPIVPIRSLGSQRTPSSLVYSWIIFLFHSRYNLRQEPFASTNLRVYLSIVFPGDSTQTKFGWSHHTSF